MNAYSFQNTRSAEFLDAAAAKAGGEKTPAGQKALKASQSMLIADLDDLRKGKA